MSPQSFRQLLLELDPATAAQHSTINHHVEGMDYLCLHRSDTLTVKLYFIDPQVIPRRSGDILVARHTHRYAFESTVLAGELVHELYAEQPGDAYERFIYSPETKTRTGAGFCRLKHVSGIRHSRGSSYWVDTRDAHTLLVPGAPVLLGLVQFADTARTSTVYLPRAHTMDYPESRRPTPGEVGVLREKAIWMMEHGRG